MRNIPIDGGCAIAICPLRGERPVRSGIPGPGMKMHKGILENGQGDFRKSPCPYFGPMIPKQPELPNPVSGKTPLAVPAERIR